MLKGLEAFNFNTGRPSIGQPVSQVVEEIAVNSPTAITDIALNLIDDSPWQRRSFYPPAHIDSLCAKIKARGYQREMAILIRPHPTKPGRYESCYGHCRRRSQAQLGALTIPAFVRELSDEEMREIAAIENLNRENLTSLEIADSIIELLEVRLAVECASFQMEEGVTLVTLLGRIRRNGKNQPPPEVVEIIQQLFSEAPFSLDTFYKMHCKALSWPDSILNAVRTGQLGFYAGAEISTIKDLEAMNQLLTQSIEENLSVRDIKAKVSELRNPYKPASNVKSKFRDDALKMVPEDRKEEALSLLDQLLALMT